MQKMNSVDRRSFLDQTADVLPVGSLVITEGYPPITILTRPFHKAEFGTFQYYCKGLINGEEFRMYIQYLDYMKPHTVPSIRVLGVSHQTYARAQQIIKSSPED
jgi:hypothetical protein